MTEETPTTEIAAEEEEDFSAAAPPHPAAAGTGEVSFGDAEAPAASELKLALRGKADRIDLLEDGTFRLIDYKLGWPPDRNRALQLPVYSLFAEHALAGHRGRHWRLGEAVYLAFKGPKRVVPLFTALSTVICPP